MSNDVAIKGSFRDPSSHVFRRDGKVLRRLEKDYLPHYEKLMKSGLFGKLLEKQLVIAHKELEVSEDFALLEPEQLRFITYPYEWSFSMLKDAALATIRIQRAALRHDMVLKDASAYNIQFMHGKPCLIDTASFETYVQGDPWIAYGQYCKHFYAPLVLASHIDPRLSRLSLLDTDGIAIDLAAALLPVKAKLSPANLVHIMTQAKLSQPKKGDGAQKLPRVEKLAVEAIAQNLEESLVDLKPAGEEKSRWADYYSTCTYSDAATTAKAQAVESCLDRLNPALVFDLGANTGRFSRLASSRKIETVAMDFDPWCVEGMYRQLVKDQMTHLTPLVQDAMNPSPSIGWDLAERDSIFQRGPADLVLALAIIHHLAIAGNVPLHSVAQMLARLGQNLLIEFVPKSDVQVKSLLALRRDIFPNYTVDGFLDAFSSCFELQQRTPLPDSERELFLFKNKVDSKA